MEVLRENLAIWRSRGCRKNIFDLFVEAEENLSGILVRLPEYWWHRGCGRKLNLKGFVRGVKFTLSVAKLKVETGES